MRTASVAARGLLLLAVALILWLALTPNPPSSQLFGFDKLNHGLAFFTLAALMEYAFPHLASWAVKLLPLAVFGLAIEMLQFRIGYRAFEWMDLAADGVGLVSFWMLRGKIKAVIDPMIQTVMKD